MIAIEASTITLPTQQPFLDVANTPITDSVATVAKSHLALALIAEEEGTEQQFLNKAIAVSLNKEGK